MAEDNTFTLLFDQNDAFSPEFAETSPLYRGIIRVWIGTELPDAPGCLYAEYSDGTIQNVGFVSDYEKAVGSGVTLTYDEWVQTIINLSDNLTRYLVPATNAEIDALFAE